ncbi:hypothetical protein [Streptomyces pini]|uniref:DUF732 domain-containing protein n=1 Tax=Streptomyces pini TaxID=1520580 RepID=A0A1I4C0D5_9ACTN|nr:hypothetical protein [Streptomyces pini]SFK73611.1 hypothetical protein SAMN05192584_108182 [Streptomyces pini]
MKKALTIAAGVIVGGFIALVALGLFLGLVLGEGEDTEPDTAAPTTSATTAPPEPSEPPATPTTEPSTPPASTPRPGGLPPKPTGADREQLLDALREIHPALVADPDDAVDNARNQCSGIRSERPVWTAQQRFSTSEHEVSEDEARRINEALRATLCP